MSDDILNVLVYSSPQIGLEGKFSMEYCLAAAVLDKEVTLSQFTDQMVRRPEIQALMKKVKLHGRPKLDRGAKNLSTEVTVSLKTGRSFSRRVEKPRGDASRPLTKEELRAKYNQCASFVLESEQINRSIKLIEKLEDVRHIGEITQLLTPSPKRRGLQCDKS
jgi:2-methylcitrate dehydratase PrpD